MATYIKLQFNDNVNINLSTSSFLYKNSLFLQSFDLNDDDNVPILCPSTYILDENGAFYFDDKNDLSFMFTLDINAFINVSNFLNIIHYDNKDVEYNKQFILYIMNNIDTNIDTNILRELSTITYFMRPEINSIMNYVNQIDEDIQIRTCTPVFYSLYLKEYKEEVAHAPSTDVIGLVIKCNRLDIFLYDIDSLEKYLPFVRKYNNSITQHIKHNYSNEYNIYINKISKQLRLVSTDFSEVKALIDSGARIESFNSCAETALHNAAFYEDNLNIIQYMIENAANTSDESDDIFIKKCINSKDKHGETPLHIASLQYNNLEVIKYLIEHGGNINIKDRNGNNVLHIVSTTSPESSLEIIKYLISLIDINLNARNKHGYTALHNIIYIEDDDIMYPVGDDKFKVIKCLVEGGADVNVPDNDGYTILHLLSEHTSNFKYIQYLIEHGANVNLQDKHGNTALHYAARQQNNLETVQYIVEHNACCNIQNFDGNTPYDLALRLRENDEVIKYLRQFI